MLLIVSILPEMQKLKDIQRGDVSKIFDFSQKTEKKKTLEEEFAKQNEESFQRWCFRQSGCKKLIICLKTSIF